MGNKIWRQNYLLSLVCHVFYLQGKATKTWVWELLGDKTYPNRIGCFCSIRLHFRYIKWPVPNMSNGTSMRCNLTFRKLSCFPVGWSWRWEKFFGWVLPFLSQTFLVKELWKGLLKVLRQGQGQLKKERYCKKFFFWGWLIHFATIIF